MDELTPEQKELRLQEDYEKGRRRDRRGPDRRQGGRRGEDKNKHQLSPKERLLWFSLITFAALGFGVLCYTLLSLVVEPKTPASHPDPKVNVASIINPYIPLEGKEYQIQLCPRLMLDNSVNMRLFKTIEDYNSCISKVAANRQGGSVCDKGTIGQLEPDSQVKTLKCDYLGEHRSHWCQVNVSTGASQGLQGFIPWDCFKDNKQDSPGSP